ncbi:NADP-dependent oxidoreductase [Chitinophaga caeni]|uniref:NADP-dependent oxidoreductase n=1 Tax=Chitinophaga caeni TaxID=2029983 RepID=A0A291QW31_9BACT|nr:NADP-dependent oxidoreductase [Chitinophaga caeni]ATL48140.1 NADP-dependent oxidoreductase [Chitinophaga caeni]
MKATKIVLASRPKGMPTAANFRFEDFEIPSLNEGELLLQPLYISVDPYMRGRMNDAKSYVPPYEVNEPISGGIVAKVLESKSEHIDNGDTVLGMLPWCNYIITHEKMVKKLDDNGVPPSYYLGILGMPGLTAYFGLMDICKPKAGETVVVSGAAGAVGTIVGQIAKIQGCNVIGIAGSDEKASMLKDDFGYDQVINYKTTTDMGQAIAEAATNGVDIYFDNVGGDITDAVIVNINFHARIALCGQISLYNETGVSNGPRILPMILTRSALIKGFIVSDYQERFGEAYQQLGTWVKEGKLVYTETIVEGFEKLPDAFLGLFSGQNQGKMLVKI